jgi:hypothetical protein
MCLLVGRFLKKDKYQKMNILQITQKTTKIGICPPNWWGRVKLPPTANPP